MIAEPVLELCTDYEDNLVSRRISCRMANIQATLGAPITA